MINVNYLSNSSFKNDKVPEYKKRKLWFTDNKRKNTSIITNLLMRYILGDGFNALVVYGSIIALIRYIFAIS